MLAPGSLRSHWGCEASALCHREPPHSRAKPSAVRSPFREITPHGIQHRAEGLTEPRALLATPDDLRDQASCARPARGAGLGARPEALISRQIELGEQIALQDAPRVGRVAHGIKYGSRIGAGRLGQQLRTARMCLEKGRNVV
eukprot:scaffold5128_cov104-Isochrysis_galbana.AAC.9